MVDCVHNSKRYCHSRKQYKFILGLSLLNQAHHHVGKPKRARDVHQPPVRSLQSQKTGRMYGGGGGGVS